MSDITDPCNKILLWAQYGPTCWFNTTLTVLFHSQYSRNMILKLSESWTNKTTMQQLAEHIVKYKYVKTDNLEKDRLFYYKVKPERILNYLHKKYPKYVKENAGNYGGNPNIILNKMYKILNIKCLMFEIYDTGIVNTNYLFYNMYNHYTHDNTILDNSYNPKPILKKKLINKLENTHKNPEVLIIVKSKYKSNSFYYTKPDFSHYYLESRNVYGYNQDTISDQNINELKSLKNTITYNKNNYILDSMILYNHNKSITNHVIAGITCNNNRYVYNGWTNYTNDPALHNTNIQNTNIQNTNIQNTNIPQFFKKELKDIPCDLMKFDWDAKKDNFCINLNECNLSLLQENEPDGIINSFKESNDLCFNFSKGVRIYIYIREDLCLKDINPNSFNTPKFKRFYVPEDLQSIYNKQPTLKRIDTFKLPQKININISTKSDDIFEIVKSIIYNYNFTNIIIIFFNYLKKYIYQINNRFILKINQNSISNLIFFKYMIILLYFVLNEYIYTIKRILNDKDINNIIDKFTNYFIKYDDIDLQRINSTELINTILNDIKSLLKKIEQKQHAYDIDVSIFNNLLKNLQLYCQIIENRYIKDPKFINLYIKYIDDKIIINYLINLKNVIVNVDQSEKSKLITSLKELENNIAKELITSPPVNELQNNLDKLEELIYNHFDKLKKLKELIYSINN
jgi:hypothetical protein